MSSDAPDDVIKQLEETRQWLRDALARSGPSDARAVSDNGQWCLADIVRHVRASDAIIAPRIMHILVRPGGLLTAYDDVLWAEALAAAEMPLEDQLAEFALRRKELAAVLRSLSEEQWQLSGEHEIRGPMTIAQIAASIADHEAEHQVQIESLLSAADG